MPKLVDRLDKAIAEKSMLKHPFYIAWNEGKLTREMLKDYACQYYHLEKEFPRMVSAVHSNTPQLEVRQHMLENLVDEERGEENHPELWLRFAEALGATRAEVEGAEQLRGTRTAVETMMDICGNGSYQEGMAALYAYESQIPEVARLKIDGLKSFYGMTDPAQYKFFTVHQEADEWHSQVERDLLERHTPDDQAADAEAAASSTAGALWGFLDGVYSEYVEGRLAA
jgi:pyrroloquinoline-quinone synthase